MFPTSLTLPVPARRRWAAGLAAAVILATAATAPALAQDRMARSEATFGEMVVDAAVLRPLGLVGTVLGTGAFIVTLPFSALGGNVGEAADQFVAKPARYTFTRPLGDI
jgi:hypothetical protein